jgi:HEAT repeat protein
MRGDGHQILREALGEDDLAVRRAALYGLALINEPWVDEKLRSVTREDKEWIVRSRAEEMLGKRHAEVPADAIAPIRADSLAWLAEWTTEKGAEVPEGPEAGALLVLVLQRSNEAAVRAAAARSLGDVGDESFLKPLKVAYQDSAEEVREAAFYGLAKIGRAWNQRLAAE